MSLSKEQAYQAMLDGHKIRHEYYSDEEFAFINKNEDIETEDGCIMGGPDDEFWAIYQSWPTGWSIVE